MNKRETGTAYELKAEEYLLGNGYKILERNFRNRNLLQALKSDDRANKFAKQLFPHFPPYRYALQLVLIIGKFFRYF